ncbi:MAG: hypothetical protein ACREDU_04580 [Methylocella sp.]
MSQTTISKRAKRTPAHGVGHGAKPYEVPPATLDEFLEGHGISAARYTRIVKQYFGKKPAMLKRAS